MIAKSIYVMLLCTMFMGFTAQTICAQDFKIERSIMYEINESPQVQVNEQVSIINKTTGKYPQIYKTQLRDIDVSEISVTGTKNNKPLEWQQQTQDNITTINIRPPENVGKNARTDINLNFKITRAAIKQGQVTEVSLPELIYNPEESISLKVAVSKSLGSPAFMHPKPEEYTSNATQMLYEFDPRKTENTGIKMAFGEHQMYQFTIFYHLRDELKNGIYYELVIPPDTSYQRVALTQFSQLPQSITQDLDGNWIAKYPIIGTNSPVVITGSIMTFATPIIPVESTHNSVELIKPDNFWESDDALIKAKAQELKTPEKIYRYVVNQLHYNYDKIGSPQNRIGAQGAINNSTDANCREFSDAFTAIARAAGIPTRVVIGYAHADNPKIQPLSYNSDILHAWPEFYDETLKNWHPVDPTWEQTTGGYDYFNNWDLKHVTFVINGISSEAPPAPGYESTQSQSKNIIVVPTNSMPPGEEKKHIDLTINNWYLPFINNNINITVHNDGLQALHQQSLTIHETEAYTASGKKEYGTIPPLGKENQEFSVKSKKIILPASIKVQSGDQQYTITLPLATRIAQISIFSIYISIYAIACYITFRLTKQAWRVSLQK